MYESHGGKKPGRNLEIETLLKKSQVLGQNVTKNVTGTFIPKIVLWRLPQKSQEKRLQELKS